MKNQNQQRQQANLSSKTSPVSSGNGFTSVNSGESFCMLRNYSEKDFAKLLNLDPTFLANDKKDYVDQIYVRSMCQLYAAIAQNTMEPLNKMQHFKISELETALIKLSQEHPESYMKICNVYGINPKTKRSKKRKDDNNTSPHLLHLCSWGYVELFQPSIRVTIDKVAKKMYSSTEMSNLEKAKYAHLFFLFIYGFNMMPYDLGRYIQLTAQHQLLNTTLTPKVRMSLLKQATNEMTKEEVGSLYEAIMLVNAYNLFFADLPDEIVNIDMIKRFINEILEEPECLKIKEFLNLLTDKEKKKFASKGLSPIKQNIDIRVIKEKIFHLGHWYTNIKLFLRNNEEKFNISVRKAYRKFAKNNFAFGANVKPYKKPVVFTHVVNNLRYTDIGYLYASSPLTVRITDVNELNMIRIYCENL